MKFIQSLRLFVFLFIVSFVLSLAGNVRAEKAEIPDPVPAGDMVSISGKVGNDNNETPGEWYIGAEPSNPKANAPVLLFVQGLNSTAQVWWEDNDMYQKAVEAGYQTAFVQLYDAGGASADMWDNGQLLADKIVEIYNYFNKGPLTIVAHSKGGVDTQTALAYYGAWPYVNHVITLSSPHHGAELADLAYSSWAGWLADLLGGQGDGTYSLQTAYMQDFRNTIDAMPEAYYNSYYTLGGTDWGPMFSSMWMGGVYLSQYGDNDGVVTVASSRLPGGEEVAKGDWNHTSIRTGVTFRVFEPYVGSVTQSQVTALTAEEEPLPPSGTIRDKKEPSFKPGASEKPVTVHPETDLWVYGGELASGVNAIPVTIENQVKELRVNLLTSKELDNAYWVDPQGKQVTVDVKTGKDETGIFRDATYHGIQLTNPKPGKWELHLETNGEDAYLLVAEYESNLNLDAVLKKSVVKVEQGTKKKQLAAQLKVNEKQIDKNSLKVTYKINKEEGTEKIKPLPAEVKKNLNHSIMLGDADGIHNVTIEIEGKTKEGYPFKRTIVRSF